MLIVYIFRQMLISAHEEQLASVTSLCKQEMKLLLGAKAGHKVSSVQEQRFCDQMGKKTGNWKYQDIPAACSSKLVIVSCRLISVWVLNVVKAFIMFTIRPFIHN